MEPEMSKFFSDATRAEFLSFVDYFGLQIQKLIY